mmetsp:Transcript_9273/g.14403  ORF Transcript_9273/g.14403 Transcript_9273/m.14403 type:complete len:138 (-) Transcript_9273:125-538(-)
MTSNTKSEQTKALDRKERRRASNRRSAQKSRYRQIVMLEELQKSVDSLKEKNAGLKKERQILQTNITMLHRSSTPEMGTRHLSPFLPTIQKQGLLQQLFSTHMKQKLDREGLLRLALAQRSASCVGLHGQGGLSVPY